MGPILSESGPIGESLAQCTRNGMLTINSEPCQSSRNIMSGVPYTIHNASVQFSIQNHNISTLYKGLDIYGNRFKIEKLDIKFSEELGPNYMLTDEYVTSFFITDTERDTNDMFPILVDISSEFTEFP